MEQLVRSWVGKTMAPSQCVPKHLNVLEDERGKLDVTKDHCLLNVLEDGWRKTKKDALTFIWS